MHGGPQNPTLEYYTSYKASELKRAVVALEELQLNIDGCSLKAVRDKYRQQKVFSHSLSIFPSNGLHAFKYSFCSTLGE